jgi:hypothetical protein
VSKLKQNVRPDNIKLVSVGLLNARSAKQQDRVSNTPIEIHDLIIDKSIDILILTETWLRDDCRDQVAIGEMTPPGYSIQHSPRPNRRGGGLAIIHRSDLETDTIKPIKFSTFECFITRVKHPKACFHLAAVYRPPQSSPAKFFDEFSELLESLSADSNHLILGDFNLPFNSKHHADGIKLESLLECANYQQHINVATHTNGHILDLIMSPITSSLQPVLKEVDRSVTSDHFAVICNLLLPRPKRRRKNINVRRWRSIDPLEFNSDITAMSASIETTYDRVTTYNSLLESLVDKHAPVRSIMITERSATPWYSVEIRHAKTHCRVLERKWQKSKLNIDHELFKLHRNNLKDLRDKAKSEYIHQKLTTATTTKDTFSILNKLLHKPADQQLPSHQTTTELTERFATFFTDKIAAVRNGFNTAALPPQPASTGNPSTVPALSCLKPVCDKELKKLIGNSPSKSCALDPAPTWLVKQCPALVSVLSNIINHSLETGVVSPTLKHALITPALKKPSLDRNQFNNYRPISNLPFTAKLMERVVSNRLEEHCEENGIKGYFQSAYKRHHSTETALLRVQNDLLLAVDRLGGAVLVLLDLSAAFDTIDHSVMLNTLHSTVGITDKALEWFRSYLSDRYQSVKIGNATSSKRPLLYGVPQGSVLGPQLFSIYTSPLQDTIQQCGMSFHLYADDTQLYLAFNPKSTVDKTEIIDTIRKTTDVINTWMKQHFLKVNSEKTEVLIITSPSIKSQIIPSVTICDSDITTSSCVRDLGVHLDSYIKMEDHVKITCKKA